MIYVVFPGGLVLMRYVMTECCKMIQNNDNCPFEIHKIFVNGTELCREAKHLLLELGVLLFDLNVCVRLPPLG